MTAIKEIIGLQKIDFKLQDIESLLGDLPLKVDALINEEKSLIKSVEKGKDRLRELELELNISNLNPSGVNIALSIIFPSSSINRSPISLLSILIISLKLYFLFFFFNILRILSLGIS